MFISICCWHNAGTIGGLIGTYIAVMFEEFQGTFYWIFYRGAKSDGCRNSIKKHKTSQQIPSACLMRRFHIIRPVLKSFFSGEIISLIVGCIRVSRQRKGSIECPPKPLRHHSTVVSRGLRWPSIGIPLCQFPSNHISDATEY